MLLLLLVGHWLERRGGGGVGQVPTNYLMYFEYSLLWTGKAHSQKITDTDKKDQGEGSEGNDQEGNATARNDGLGLPCPSFSHEVRVKVLIKWFSHEGT